MNDKQFFGGLVNSQNAAYAADPPGQSEKVARPRDVSSEMSSLHGAVASINATAGNLRERLESVMRSVPPTAETLAGAVQSPTTKLGQEIRGHHDFLREIDKTLREVLDRLEI